MCLQNFHTTFTSNFILVYLWHFFTGFMGWTSSTNKGFFRLSCQLTSVVHSGSNNTNYFWRMSPKQFISHLQNRVFLFVCLLIFYQEIYVTVHITVITLYFVWYVMLSLYSVVVYSYLMPLIFIRMRRSCSYWSEVCWILCVCLCDFARLTLLLQLAIQAAFRSFKQAAGTEFWGPFETSFALRVADCAEWGSVFSV